MVRLATERNSGLRKVWDTKDSCFTILKYFYRGIPIKQSFYYVHFIFLY